MPSVPHPGAGVPEGEKEDNSAFGALPYGGHSCVLAMGGGEPKKGNVGSSASPSLLPHVPLTKTPSSQDLPMLPSSSFLGMG